MVTTELFVAKTKNKIYHSIEIKNPYPLLTNPKSYERYMNWFYLETMFFDVTPINYSLFKKMAKKHNAVFVRHACNITRSSLDVYSFWAFEKKQDAIAFKENVMDPLIIATLLSK